ncbi:MAG: ribonuclease Z [Candidatus Anstonellales archaeon]
MSAIITFLGTSGSIPSVERGMPSFALNWQGEIFLFDAGEGFQRQMMRHRVGYGSVSHVFISHLHLDHFIGLYGFIETLRLSGTKKLFVHAPRGFEKLLINKWDFLEVKEIKEGEILRGKDYSISAFKVKHGGRAFGFVFEEDDRIRFDEKKAKSFGIRGKLFSEIEKKKEIVINGRKILLSEVSWVKPGRKIIYTGDTLEDERIVEHAKDADVLIHEATFLEEHKDEAEKRMHSTAAQAAKTASKANVKTLVLTHISPRYHLSDEEKFIKEAKKYFDGNVMVARDGMTIEV